MTTGPRIERMISGLEGLKRLGAGRGDLESCQCSVTAIVLESWSSTAAARRDKVLCVREADPTALFGGGGRRTDFAMKLSQCQGLSSARLT